MRVGRNLSPESGWGLSMASSVALHATAIASLYAGSWWWTSAGQWEVIPPEQGFNSAASMERRVIEVAAPSIARRETTTEPIQLAAAVPRAVEPTPQRVAISPVGTIAPPSAPSPQDVAPEVAALAPVQRLADRTVVPPEDVEPSAPLTPMMGRHERMLAPTTLASARAAAVARPSTTASAASNPNRGAQGIPTPIFNPTPVYPPQLMAARIEGVVKLRVELDETGRVVRAEVTKPSGQAAFDRAALDVIYRWRFTSSSASVPLQRTLTVPIRFGIVE